MEGGGRPRPHAGLGSSDKDVWELFHTDEDRAEAHDLADQHPEKVDELVRVWFAEAGEYDVLPLDDRLPMEILMDERPSLFDAEGSYVFYPGTSDLPQHASPNLRGRSFSIHATVELEEAAEGVLPTTARASAATASS